MKDYIYLDSEHSIMANIEHIGSGEKIFNLFGVEVDDFDTFEPGEIGMVPWKFKPSRSELWQEGQCIEEKQLRQTEITSCVWDSIDTMFNPLYNNQENGEFKDLNIESSENIKIKKNLHFDRFITNNDRILMMTIPDKTNIASIGITNIKAIYGATCKEYIFEEKEPYCCSLFFQNKQLVKETFSFGSPERLLEFYK